MADVIAAIATKLPESLILGVLGMIVLTVLIAPIALRLAGLTSQQIVDVLSMTTKFLIEIISEFRSENKSNK